jgi:hypothetical protein
LGAAHLPATVIQQAYSQQEVATTLFDPVAFDPGQPPGILQPRIQQYLDAFQPSILLVCPPAAGQPAAATHSRQVPVNQWLEAIQSRAAQGRTPGVAMIATLTSEGAETSTSSAALATQVGQLLGDLAWPSNQVLQAWEPPTSGLAGSSREPRRGTAPTDSRVIGVRRLISIEDTQLTWFNARSAPNDPRVAGLSMRPVRSRTSATNIDAISRMTNKVNWLHQMARVETRSPQARAQWQRGLTLSLSYLPESMHAIWLAELAEQCEAAGDPRKATLARWEALHAFLDSPAGLVALLPTVQWLISDEAQWENRSEAQAVRREKFAELQRLFAQEAAEGPLSDEDRKARALRRFGIEPHLESKVPPEIVERILLLDQVQRQAARDGQIQPTAEVRQAAALPQSRVLTEQDSRQYQNQAGQLQRLSTVLTWDTPLLPDPGGGSSAAPPAGEPSSMTIVDLPDNQRLELANRLISRADSLWPALNGLPQWWLLKAQVKQQSQDIVQTDLAWNRLALMAADPRVAALHPADLPPASKIAQHKRVALARAEAGDRVDLRSLSQRPVSHFSTQTGGMSPPEEVSVPLLPVTWTLERPFLDGRCDEELWSHDASNSVLRLAQDEQYLYVAIQSPGLETAGPRSADRAPKSMTSDAVPAGERDQADRQNGLSLRIDTDGDGRDSFVIHFDTQGQVADLQGRFEHWNPKLFVAQTVTPTQWTIEMAIDLEDLSLERLGQPWQIQLQQAPSDSTPPLVQAWTQLAHPLH